MPEHGRVCSITAFLLESFGRQSKFGYTLCNDTAIQTAKGPDTVRGADVSYYSQARWPREQVGGKLPPVPPDIVVEVVSPGDSAAEVQCKVGEYLEVGVLTVWVVYPRSRKLLIYRPDQDGPVVLTEAEVLEEVPELPGFRCTIADLFV
jgi:Uma2 family endonuclease